MRKIKKALALSLALAMGLSLVACGSSDDTTSTSTSTSTDDTAAVEDTADAEDASDDTAEEAAEEASVPVVTDTETAIYVYSWNTELGTRIEDHFNTKYPEYADLVIYQNLDTSGTGDDYKASIANAVSAGGDMVPSVVAADNDVALYFMEQTWAVPLSDIGLTSAMYANAYDYTVEYATVDGELKAMTWQAASGSLAYRIDIAEEVLGTSDPDEVQNYVSDWDAFLETAALMKEAGYYMLSGTDDIKYAMIDQKTEAWVVDGALVVDSSVTDYLELSKTLYDEGYTKNTSMWDSDWTANMVEDVFCYFGCTWFVQWSLSEDSYGTWNVCVGPVSYHWGGSYLVVTDQCANPGLAALLIYTLCCDEEVMYDLYADDYDFPNNQASVAQLIADGVGANDILNGQNPLEAWDECAKGLSLDCATAYDATFNGYLDVAAAAYNTGEVDSVDAAVASIKSQVAAVYSEITIE